MTFVLVGVDSCVKPLCAVMLGEDPKMIEVVLDALDNIFRAWDEICR
jgi:flagellin-specific chaperone FliS